MIHHKRRWDKQYAVASGRKIDAKRKSEPIAPESGDMTRSETDFDTVGDAISDAADLASARVNPALCSALAEQVMRAGIGIIPGFFSASLIAEAASFAHDAVKANNGEYRSFGGNVGLPGFLLGTMGAAPWFQELCQGVYREMIGKAPPPHCLVQVFRCLSGSTGRANSDYFHYDSSMVTILVPVVIPQGGRQDGRLVLLANARPVRRSYLLNLCEKAVLELKWAQSLLRRKAKMDPRWLWIDLEPGNLYVFCGYRSLHANEPCDEQDLRATLLFHYANPHKDSRIRRLLRR